MAVSGGLTLEQAIRDKYCSPLEEEEEREEKTNLKGDVTETALVYKPGGCAIGRRHSIVLDHSGVVSVGSERELKALCPSVQELHLGGNAICNWDDVCAVLSSLSSLSLLDLSRNPLQDTFCGSTKMMPSGLSVLVLNSTDISWPALQACLQLVPSLQELHLSNNQHSTVTFDPSFSLPSVEKLYLNNNSLSKWEELSKLSPAFPSLKMLVMCGSPLENIPPFPSDQFCELVTLTLHESLLSDWTSVEHLSSLVSLKELGLMNVPLGKELEVKERRFAAVARLPGLSKLNKTSITETEREDAERWFIRQYSGTQHPLLDALSKKHRHVNHLATVNMRKKKRVKLEFHFEGNCEIHVTDLKQTTKQLKAWVGEKLVGMPVSTFRMFYHDPDCWTGSEEMKQGTKQLYTYYPMNENDQIHIEMKPSRTSKR